MNNTHRLFQSVLYFTAMMQRERLAILVKNDQVVALCTYFILNDESEIQQFHERPLWTLPLDHPDGMLCYIDKLIADGWSLTMRKEIQKLITQEHPNLQTVCWFRAGAGPDRLITRPILEVSCKPSA